MKNLLMSLAVLAMLGTNVSFASPQAVDADAEQGMCTPAAAPTEAQNEEAALADVLDETDDQAQYGYWHCTAYAEGHGHSWGFDYRDIHYSHAYYGAMRRCEWATGHHCHDVHCHYDHH